jgi:hypothetical protein
VSQTQFGRGRLAQRADNVRRRVNLGKEGPRQRQSPDHLIGPDALPNVGKAAGGGIAFVGAQFAGQLETEKILRQHPGCSPFKRLRFKLLQPVQGGDRKSRRGWGPALLGEEGSPDALFDFGQQLCAALVGPDDRWPQQALVLVEQHQAMHLAGKADAQDFWVPRLIQRFANRSDCCSPLLFGVLLCVPETGVRIGYSANPIPFRAPSTPNATTFTLEVPRSMPSRQLMLSRF